MNKTDLATLPGNGYFPTLLGAIEIDSLLMRAVFYICQRCVQFDPATLIPDIYIHLIIT